MKQILPIPITAEDVEELALTNRIEAVMIRWRDTGEVQIVSQKLFADATYENRTRPHEVIISQTDLELLADEDPAEITPAQCAELARGLNRNQENHRR